MLDIFTLMLIQAKVKQSFPLVSVGRVDYDGSNDPTRFTLTFSNFTAILRANSVKEANDWVEKIIEGEMEAYERIGHTAIHIHIYIVVHVPD